MTMRISGTPENHANELDRLPRPRDKQAEVAGLAGEERDHQPEHEEISGTRIRRGHPRLPPWEQHDVGDDVEYESWHPNEHCPKWHPAPSEVVRQDTRHAEGEDARSQDDVITESEKASP